MIMKRYKVFLDSSEDLVQERIEIKIMVLRLNKKWNKEKGASLELVTPEDMPLKKTGVTFKDSITQEMLDCDIVITLFSRKVAKLLEDEFKLAYENFKKGNKPHFMLAYFKSGSVPIEEIDDELLKVGKLKKQIQEYKDIYGVFNSEEDLIPKIQQRLEAAIFHEHKSPLLNLPISLKRLKLHNIKCFQDVEVSFLEKEKSRPWTLLVGDNGVGKTTILQSIALCSLGPELVQGRFSNPQSMLRVGEDEGYLEAEFDASFDDATPGNSPSPIVIRLNIKKGSRIFEIAQSGDQNRDEKVRKFIDARNRTDFEGWFVAGYGPVRNLIFSDEPFKMAQQDTVMDRIESLFKPTKLLVDPIPLYRFLSGDSSSFSAIGAPSELNRDTTRYIQELLIKLLPRISFNGSVAQGNLETPFGRVPITELSEGYKSMLSWLAHLMIHLLRAVHWDGNINDIKGIVLIDELDLHLHPAWQQKVIPLLQDCFPNLQFIGCTHSPMTAGGAG
ncbi:MAG: AAA family ATPase, partial [Acidobacteria bacterium]|nr:AAA family ATPase [Acidobacteriota bacterium]